MMVGMVPTTNGSNGEMVRRVATRTRPSMPACAEETVEKLKIMHRARASQTLARKAFMLTCPADAGWFLFLFRGGTINEQSNRRCITSPGVSTWNGLPCSFDPDLYKLFLLILPSSKTPVN